MSKQDIQKELAELRRRYDFLEETSSERYFIGKRIQYLEKLLNTMNKVK